MLKPAVVVPDKLSVMPQPSLQDVEDLKQQGYRSIINNRPDNEKLEQPNAAEVRAEARERGMHYEHMPVTLTGITYEDVMAFRQAFTLGPHPVAAHCASGKRSFLLWAVGEVLDKDASIADLTEKARALGYEIPELPDLVERVKSQQE